MLRPIIASGAAATPTTSSPHQAPDGVLPFRRLRMAQAELRGVCAGEHCKVPVVTAAAKCRQLRALGQIDRVPLIAESICCGSRPLLGNKTLLPMIPVRSAADGMLCCIHVRCGGGADVYASLLVACRIDVTATLPVLSHDKN